MRFLIKTLITALLIAGISEIGKKSTWLGAILASLPLTSILAMIWLYRDTQSVEKVALLSKGIFYAIIPSLLFFLLFPALLKTGIRFSFALFLASFGMFLSYSGYLWALGKLGVSFWHPKATSRARDINPSKTSHTFVIFFKYYTFHLSCFLNLRQFSLQSPPLVLIPST